MNNVTKLPTADGVVETAPCEIGAPVVIEGRLIPKLRAVVGEDHVRLILDDRFEFAVPAQCSKQVASAIATALAIGEGFPSMHAESRERSFAPQVCKIELED